MINFKVVDILEAFPFTRGANLETFAFTTIIPLMILITFVIAYLLSIGGCLFSPPLFLGFPGCALG